MESCKHGPNHDVLFDRLKMAVLDASLGEHQWDNKALDYLVNCLILAQKNLISMFAV